MKSIRGMSLSSFLAFAVVTCILGLSAMKIAPVYFNHYRVNHALEKLKSIPKSDLNQSPVMVAKLFREQLAKQFYINGVRDIKSKDIHISFHEHYYAVDVEYELRRHFFANITMLFEFHASVEVTSG